MSAVLAGKSAIVIGAGSGFGRVSALRFAEEGACVVAADVDLGQAKQTVRKIEEVGGTGVPFRVDVTNEGQIRAVMTVAVDCFGQLDILFNNVSMHSPHIGSTIEGHTLEDFNRLVAVNLGGVFLGCKYAVLQFKKQGGGGVILNRGSVEGLVVSNGPLYGAAKGGVLQLTRVVAIETAPFGIRVNAICPAALPVTDFVADGERKMDATQWRRIAEKDGVQRPLRGVVTVEDCVDAAVFLVSDAARHITGVAVPVYGGYVIG
ncbi:SDR family NAD(P)-dependent oxidoreductase [Mycobacterium syngnathidarum]